MKSIVLIGMRGSGKSKIGKKIAKKLQREFIDLDQEIEKFAGEQIPEIVAKKGWPHFRNLEKEITKKFSEKENLVIATGGGVVLDPENIKNLKKNGIIVLLEVSVKTIKNRIKWSKKRPSLTGNNFLDEVEKVWEERKNKYFAAADLVLNVDGRSNNKEEDLESKAQKIIALSQELTK